MTNVVDDRESGGCGECAIEIKYEMKAMGRHMLSWWCRGQGAVRPGYERLVKSLGG